MQPSRSSRWGTRRKNGICSVGGAEWLLASGVVLAMCRMMRVPPQSENEDEDQNREYQPQEWRRILTEPDANALPPPA